jgi:hypothetical protein
MIFDFFSAHGKVLQVSLFKSLNQSNRFSGLGCANVKFAIRSEGEEVMAKLNHTQVK